MEFRFLPPFRLLQFILETEAQHFLVMNQLLLLGDLPLSSELLSLLDLLSQFQTAVLDLGPELLGTLQFLVVLGKQLVGRKLLVGLGELHVHLIEHVRNRVVGGCL